MVVRNRSTLLRSPLTLALAAALVLPTAAFAQQAEEKTKDLDKVTVTGSRIRGASMETQQPIMILSRQELEQQGYTSVVDVLQSMTSAGSPAISRSEALASGENVGGYYIDIRNLGATRTLVLVNGKRLGATSGGYQDLSQIPMSAIERIEVLKDGASSIYGSDAIAGVVNVITRNRFSGGEANVYLGRYGEGDGDTKQYSFTLGAEGERGSLTLSAEYSKQDPVWAKDRWFSRDGSKGPNSTPGDWSTLTQHGTWCDPRVDNDCLYDKKSGERVPVWLTLNPGGDPTNPNDYHALTPAEYSNANQQMMLQTGIERKSIYINGTYDFTDSISLNTDLLYNERRTSQQIAGYPYQSQAFGTPLSGDSAFSPIPGTDVEFRRRLWEVPRSTESQLKTLRFAPTVSGYFDFADRTFDWSVGALVNRNELVKTNRGDMSLIAARQALGQSFIDADGVARCGTAANPIDGCYAWNPLLPNGVAGPGSLASKELQEFLFPTFSSQGVTKTTSYTADLSGSIISLPAGDLGFAVGIEHRKEEGRYVPDAFMQSGEYTGLKQSSTNGSYELDEAYLELNVPVLADKRFAKELTINVAGRYSDYSNFGDTTNGKFGITWRPLDELLVRGTYAEGFRAPSIDDMHGGVSATFDKYTDPCSVGVPGSVAGNAACTSAGVAPNYVQLGQGYVPCTSWPCQTPDEFISGANPNLRPESSRSKTMGLVWSPRWVAGLDISVDWYNYKLTNMIISDSPDRILRDCYVLGNSARCASIVRAADGHIVSMFRGLANLGQMETEGYDLGVKYKLPELPFGQFRIDWQNTYTAKYDEVGQNSKGENIIIGNVGAPGIFRLRSNLSLNWELGNWGANFTSRYYSGMKEGCISAAAGWCDKPDNYANGEKNPLRLTGANTFHDLQANYKTPWKGTVAIGANNVFNHRGSLQYSAPNSDYAYYGGFDIGRFIYVKYTQRF